MVDPERDPAAAPGGENPLGRQRYRTHERDLRPPVDRRDLDVADLLEPADDLLHPEVAHDQRLEVDGRAEECQKLLAIHVDRQRLLTNDFTGDLVGVGSADPKVGAHDRLAGF